MLNFNWDYANANDFPSWLRPRPGQTEDHCSLDNRPYEWA